MMQAWADYLDHLAAEKDKDRVLRDPEE